MITFPALSQDEIKTTTNVLINKWISAYTSAVNRLEANEYKFKKLRTQDQNYVDQMKPYWATYNSLSYLTNTELMYLWVAMDTLKTHMMSLSEPRVISLNDSFECKAEVRFPYIGGGPEELEIVITRLSTGKWYSFQWVKPR